MICHFDMNTHWKKQKARNIARYHRHKEMKKGIIKEISCKYCGNQKVYIYHDDYNKPLEYAALCNKHYYKMIEVYTLVSIFNNLVQEFCRKDKL